MSRRENTFRIDYAKLPKKPSYDELHNFIGIELGLKREEVQRIQCSRYLGCVFVKTSDQSIAQKIVDEHDGKHELVVDKKSYPIRIWMEDGGVDVRLYDLSEDVQNQTIIDFLSQFGEVLSIRDQPWEGKYLFEGLSSGIRIARMIVKKNIPSIITIDSEQTCVSYNGQLQSCRHCNELIHSGISCIQNKKLLIQKLTADQGSYANVAKQSGPLVAQPTTSQPQQTASTLASTKAGKPNKSSSTHKSTQKTAVVVVEPDHITRCFPAVRTSENTTQFQDTSYSRNNSTTSAANAYR